MDCLEMANKRVTKTLTSLILIGFFREVRHTGKFRSYRDFPYASVPKRPASPIFNFPSPPSRRAALVIIELPLNTMVIRSPQFMLGSPFMLCLFWVWTNKE